MPEYRTGESPAASLRLTARAALLRIYMKKEATHSVELEDTVRWFAQNASDHPQYQEYLRQKRQPKTLLGKLFRRRTII